MNTNNYHFRPHQVPVLIIVALLMFLTASSCQHEERGFALPEGNANDGKIAFQRLDCNSCHSVGEIAWKGQPDDPNVPLGGKVSKLKSYGELVASVINPSHKISKPYLKNTSDSLGHSKMMVYNQFLTVQELVDIVTFLRSKYNFEPPEVDYYRHFY